MMIAMVRSPPRSTLMPLPAVGIFIVMYMKKGGALAMVSRLRYL